MDKLGYKIEEAFRRRECECGEEIHAGTKHLVYYYKWRKNLFKRHNYCTECATLKVKSKLKDLFKEESLFLEIEKELKEING